MDFGKGIYTEIYEYTDNDGIPQKILLKPLKGKNFKDFFSSLNKLKEAGNDSDKALEILSGETSIILHSLCVDTIMNSYPDSNKEDVELFVSSHLMKLFPIIVKLNTRE